MELRAKLISILMMLSLPVFGAAIHQSPVRGIVVAAAGGCTVNSGDVFNECFENAGYELGGWTEVAGTPDEDAALPSALSRLGSQALRIQLAEDTEYIRKDEGSAVTSGTRWFRFYFYVDSWVATDGVGYPLELLSGWEGTDQTDTDARAFMTWIYEDGPDVYQLKARGDSVATLDVNISLDTWYRVEIEWVRGSTSSMKVYNTSDTQIGTTQTFTAGSLADWRYTVAGQVTTNNTTPDQTADYYIDGIGVSSTAYLGQ